MLQCAHVRLLTLTGTGGVGKTRLALAVLTELAAFFPAGVHVISLASLQHADLMLPAIAQKLGLRQEREQNLSETLHAFLQKKRVLLLLDNFEQLASGAPLLVDLLVHCPDIKILVTSRELLRVRGEHVYQLQPLPLPDLSQQNDLVALACNEAFSLFVQRVQSLDTSFRVSEENAHIIAKICVRLDGLPLALELAAAHMKVLAPEALLARLEEHRLSILTRGARELPTRQQTLRATLAWSYDLLTVAEQRFFRRLAVFADGFTLAALEHIYTGDSALEALTSLVEKNLVQQREQRFFLLETIREYGLECLEASGESQQMRHAHADYYLTLAENAEPYLLGAEGLTWLERLDQERENLRVALQGWMSCAEHATALRMGNALRQYWSARGYGHEGYQQMVALLQAKNEHIAPILLARSLLSAGILAHYQQEQEQCLLYCEESLRLFRQLEDRQGIAAALKERGRAAFVAGKWAEARTFYTESLSLVQASKDWQGIAETQLLLAEVLHSQVENQVARELAEKSLHLFRKLGQRRGEASATGLLAFIAGYYQEHRKALALAEESLQIFRDLNAQWEVATQLHYVATLATRQNDHERALLRAEESLQISLHTGHREAIARALYLLAILQGRKQGGMAAVPLLEQSLALYQELGNQEGIAFALQTLAQQAFFQKEYRAAQALSEKSLQIFVEREHKPALIEALSLLGRILAVRGEIAWAVRLLGIRDALREAIGLTPVPPRSIYRYITALMPVPASEQEMTCRWQEGRSMTPGQAVVLRQQRKTVRPTLNVPIAAVYLTPREKEVLSLLSTGLTNPQIAVRLMVSVVTINAHVRSIYNKLNVSSRSAATRYALEQQLF